MHHAALATEAAGPALAPPSAWPEPQWVTEAVERGWLWARIQWNRAASQPNAFYDAKKAEAVVANWPKWFQLTNDRFRGKPFHLNPWQSATVRMLVGWKIPEEILDEETLKPRIIWVRMFRKLLLWIARKGGKTEFLASLGLLFFVLEKVPGGEGYVFAKNEKQGRIAFKKMCVMAQQNPDLAKAVQVFKNSLYVPEIDGSIQLLSGKAEGKHGANPTVIVGDEMHEWISTELSETLRQGTGARLQPIELYASTAGARSKGVGFQLFEESQAILDGVIESPSTLVVIFAANPDDDPFDEATWKKANPTLGLTPTLRFMRDEAAKAKGGAGAEAKFRCFHLNQWVDSAVKWFKRSQWRACTDDPTSWKRFPEELIGKRCFGAVDISNNKDITALILWFPPESPDEKAKLICRFWLPQAALDEYISSDKRNPWRDWVASGAVEVMPGEVINQSIVMRAMIEAREKYDLRLMGRDPWNTGKLWTDLQAEGWDPQAMVNVRQTIQTLSEPTRDFETLVKTGKLDHGGNPVLDYMADGVTLHFDANLNYKPSRQNSHIKIDGIVAAVMCCGLAGINTTSVYEDRGILRV